jgi:predicted GNAT family acetyltransferase
MLAAHAGRLTGMDVDVVHLPDRSRFEAEVEGSTAYLSYEKYGDTVAMTHTMVPPEIGGRGIAGELTRTAVDWARGESLQVDPQCSYIRAWLSKNG